MGYIDSLDIANRALMHCEAPPLTSITEDSTACTAVTNAYDKVRRAELRRNNWRFAIKKVVLRPVDADTMVIQPTLWAVGSTYLPGAIVSDANGVNWISLVKDNVANQPGANNTAWDMYFGPLTISPYDTTGSTAYWAGELVYLPGSIAGTFVIYQSLVSANADVPNVATPWSSTTTYHSDMVVSYSGSQWRSLIEVNLGITPSQGPLAWAVGTTYAATNTVTGSDQFIYSSVGNGNVGNNPVTDGGVHWTNTGVVNAWSDSPTIPVSDIQWQVVSASMKNLVFQYPVGTGPVTQSETRNVYHLPANYLAAAQQDPKAGSVNFLGAPSGEMYKDWLFEGRFIVSRDAYPILFRFVADITKVSEMDDMFCEGLACRIAVAIAPSVTNSNVKLQTIASAYKEFMGEARRTNMIETGPVEPPEDDFVTCRL